MAIFVFWKKLLELKKIRYGEIQFLKYTHLNIFSDHLQLASFALPPLIKGLRRKFYCICQVFFDF